MDGYARMLRHARGLGLVTLLDTSGEALRRGVEGMPHVLKVNQHEMEALGADVRHVEAFRPDGNLAGNKEDIVGECVDVANQAFLLALRVANDLKEQS